MFLWIGWMSVKKWVGCVYLALAIVSIQPQPSIAKCISLEITLEGEIVGIARDDLAISVEVASRTRGDSKTDVRQESRVEGSHFYATAWFNTTSNIMPAETCDRLPEIVIVNLMSGGRVLDRQTLKIESAFRRTKEGDYKLKQRLALHVPVEK